MNLLHRWRRFWSGSYVPRSDLYATHLKACAPTVTPEETARLEALFALRRGPREVERAEPKRVPNG